MPRKGENIFKRQDGRWEGRHIKAHNGRKAVYGYVFEKSYSEVRKKKLKQSAVLTTAKMNYKNLHRQKVRFLRMSHISGLKN